MKKFSYWLAGSVLHFAFLSTASVHSDEIYYQPPKSDQQTLKSEESKNQQPRAQLRIGVANTKRCIEESKLGQEGKASLEKMQKQMEAVLHDKESDLEEIESKLNDDDYMDSISEDAANDLKRKKRQIRTDGAQLQNQYMQTLQKANMELLKNVTDEIAKASAEVAGDKSSPDHYDAIFAEEAFNFYSPDLDVTDKVILKMNEAFDKDKKESEKRKEANKGRGKI